MTCANCVDPQGVPCLPQYGMAPHYHVLIPGNPAVLKAVFLPEAEWPQDFEEDPENRGYGVWFCLNCGDM